MSDIQSLILRTDRLSQSADWWDTAMIWALAFTAFAAVAVVVTTRMALLRTKESADAQDAVTRAKEEKFTLELKDKDLKIAELQKAGLPRNLDVHKTAVKLKQFAGTPLSTETLMEFESDRTTRLIIAAISEAKWKLHGQGASSGMGMSQELARPGVWVRPSHGPPEENGPVSGQVIRHSKKELAAELARYTKAAEALIQALNDEGITAHLLQTSPQSNEGGVHVFVSLKPFPGMADDLRVTMPKD